MLSGDGNADGETNNRDKDEVWFFKNGSTGYSTGDFDMDGSTDIFDKDDFWFPNAGRGSQVPE